VLVLLVACLGSCRGACGAPSRDDAGACSPIRIPVLGELPTLYFVVDHSGSMAEHDKWTSIKSAVDRIMTDLGPTARFGATMFPAPQGGCEPGTETLFIRVGDSRGGMASALPTSAEARPSGGTPMAATLRSLLPDLANAPKPTYVILATDGGPNCNPALRCGVAECTANLDHLDPMCTASENCCEPNTAFGPKDCLDDAAARVAVEGLARAGIPTYVIGIPGSEPYERVLDALARAGGTGRAGKPAYYRSETDDVHAITAIFQRVAAKITASCEVSLARAPDRPEDVTVSLGGAPVDRGAFSLEGQKLRLLGRACERALAGDGLGLAVLEGCAHER
jgi:hypothetical protein